MQNKFVSIIKSPGLTSSDVVVRARNILSRKLGRKIKAGHMGTLDPGAAGVLIVGFEKTNRLFEYLLKKNKSYIGRLTFGLETDTLDSFGKVISKSHCPKKEDVLNVLQDFIGEIDQIPPKYSALKINGQKAYELARKNQEVVINARKTNIYDIKPLRFEEKDGVLKSIDLFVNCSSGTYIRTLFVDIAHKVNCNGYMSYLIRQSVHNIKIEDSCTLSEFENCPEKYLLDAEKLLDGIMDFFEVNDKDYELLATGRYINIDMNDGYVAITKDNKLKFIASVENKKAKSVSNFE